MEHPFIGKRADVLNKKAVFALTKNLEGEALNYWEEALAMKDDHFST